jgi:hypothetical protein
MSTIAVDNARPSAGGTATSLIDGLPKAAARYNQNGPTVINSQNLSSITDTAAGRFTPNLSNVFDAAASIRVGGCSTSDQGAAAGGTFSVRVRGDSLGDQTYYSVSSPELQSAFTSSGSQALVDYTANFSLWGDLA